MTLVSILGYFRLGVLESSVRGLDRVLSKCQESSGVESRRGPRWTRASGIRQYDAVLENNIEKQDPSPSSSSKIPSRLHPVLGLMGFGDHHCGEGWGWTFSGRVKFSGSPQAVGLKMQDSWRCVISAVLREGLGLIMVGHWDSSPTQTLRDSNTATNLEVKSKSTKPTPTPATHSQN